MKKLLILSGKGGTGKTTTAAAFLRFSQAEAAADCDVDAPNLHIVNSKMTLPEQTDFYGSEKSKIQEEQCIGCGLCMQHCRFGAIELCEESYHVNEYACEGCGVCAHVCPVGAARLVPDVAGEVSLYRGEQTFATAVLKMGRGNSGKLVSEVKNVMTQAALEAKLAIIDGSPGIGCPVIASMTGVDLVLIVTEPSLSGLSDLKRIAGTAAIFQVPALVCVNKYDTSPENTRLIEEYCREQKLFFAGRIPYDKQASAAINAGKSVADFDCAAARALREIYDRVMDQLQA